MELTAVAPQREFDAGQAPEIRGFQPVQELPTECAARDNPKTPVDIGIDQVLQILPPEDGPKIDFLLAQEVEGLNRLALDNQSIVPFSAWASGVLYKYRVFLKSLGEIGQARTTLIERLRLMTQKQDAWARKSEFLSVASPAEKVKDRFEEFRRAFTCQNLMLDIQSILDEIGGFRKRVQSAPFAADSAFCDQLEVCLTKIQSALSRTFQDVQKTVEFCSDVQRFAQEAVSSGAGRTSASFLRMRSLSRGSVGRPLSALVSRTPTPGGQRTPLVGAEGEQRSVFTFDEPLEEKIDLAVFERDIDVAFKLNYFEEMVEKHVLKKIDLKTDMEKLKPILSRMSLTLLAPRVLERRKADLRYLDQATSLLDNTAYDTWFCLESEWKQLELFDKMLVNSTLSDNVETLSDWVMKMERDELPQGELIEWKKTVKDLRLTLIGIIGKIRETDEQRQRSVVDRLIQLAGQLEPGFEKEIEAQHNRGDSGAGVDPVTVTHHRAPRLEDFVPSAKKGIDSEVSSVAGSEEGEEVDVFGNPYSIDEKDDK